MNADLFTLLLTMGLATGPALAGTPAPVSQPARPFEEVMQVRLFEEVMQVRLFEGNAPMEKRLGNPKPRFCFREEVEAGAPKECAKFRLALKNQPFEMIVFPAK